jgi:hypothetical protein
VQQNGDSVHQHGALIGDDLDRRTDAAGVVGRVDRDLGVARRTLSADLHVGGKQRR